MMKNNARKIGLLIILVVTGLLLTGCLADLPEFVKLQNRVTQLENDVDYTIGGRLDKVENKVNSLKRRSAKHGRFIKKERKRNAKIANEVSNLKIWQTASGSNIHVFVSPTPFDRGSSTLPEKTKTWLNKVIREMKDEGMVPIKIIGHTSPGGSNAYNKELELRRAEAGKAYLGRRFPEVAADIIVINGGVTSIRGRGWKANQIIVVVGEMQKD